MENIRTHPVDFALLNEFFTGLERQGPGSPAETLRALGFVGGLSGESNIADLGCGTGFQTMVLAQQTAGRITALDLCAGSIEKLNATAQRLGLQQRVKGIVGSMEDLPFGRETVDLIWCEGAIANIGFERGLRAWRDSLKTDGYVAVSYESWLTTERPAEIEQWWVDAVPEIATVGHNVSLMQRAGYLPVAVFTMPESCWTEHYFRPQQARQEAFLQQYPESPQVAAMIAFLRREAALYDKYHRYYGYVFYIGKKL
ncbi:MAG: class I SAM-dependent methyltransferase [Eubacteriales bacterium]